MKSPALLSSLTLVCLAATSALAQEIVQPKTAQTFEIEGGKGFIYPAPQPAKDKPWVWYAPTLKGVSIVQRKFYFDSFMRAGISTAGFDVGEVRGAPGS